MTYAFCSTFLHLYIPSIVSRIRFTSPRNKLHIVSKYHKLHWSPHTCSTCGYPSSIYDTQLIIISTLAANNNCIHIIVSTTCSDRNIMANSCETRNIIT